LAAAITYRADIDGLRALSVLAVIAYHAQMGLSGGFVGVDVFFVISGYLITSLIVKDLEKRSFSLAEFWERRIRRIWPAATVMVSVVLLAGLIVLLPVDFRLLGGDAVGHIKLMANIHYWRSLDYFGFSADLRPLLHTWSLAVEEQFYIFFPPLLMLLWRLPRRHVTTAVGVLLIASLVWSVVLSFRDPAANFYLLPSRAWELLVGSYLALARPAPLRSLWRRDMLGVLGLLLICVPMFLYDESTRFPGLAAIPPCLGAAIMIRIGDGAPSAITRVLSWNPVRIIGLMSYSLYLWHWPVLAFMRYVSGSDLSLYQRFAAVSLCGVLAFLSWRFVERPFRHMAAGQRFWRVLLVAVGVSGAMLIGCRVVRDSDGFPGRFSPEVLAHGTPTMVTQTWTFPDKLPSEQPLLPKSIGHAATGGVVDFVLWGDSHGQAISGTVDALAREHQLSGVAFMRAGTISLPAVWRPKNGGEERETVLRWSAAVKDWILANRPRNLILCSRWSVYIDGRPGGAMDQLIAPLQANAADRESALEAAKTGLRELIALCETTDTTVWVLQEVPFQNQTPRGRAAEAKLRGGSMTQLGVSLAEHRRHQQRLAAFFTEFRSERLRLIDLADGCFSDDGRSRVSDQGRSLYYDSDHLAPEGVDVLARKSLDEMFHAIADEVRRSAR
jgi:peptidoglycan/LPS O-acetylase OafA/YrhL